MNKKRVPEPSHFRLFLLSLGLLITIGSCNRDVEPDSPATDSYDHTLAVNWAELQLRVTKTTPAFGPTVSARAYAYAGLTMYESVVPGSADHRSLAGQLSGLTTLPSPETGRSYNWALSLNAGQAAILKSLYGNTSDANKSWIDSLETAMLNQFKGSSAPDVVDRSVAFGRAIAAAIFEWSKTDGGHEGYKNPFPADYKVAVCAGCWQATENGRSIPMTPYWGKNRPMVAANATLTPPQPLKYSTSPTSQYFAQYLEVYTKNKTLTQEEKEIAVWWADNPGDTFTPPGHSYAVAAIAARTAKASLSKAAEGFCRVGIAVNDAFIACWKCKFQFNNERPYTFVRYTIDPAWKPFWPSPPFPGYASGHATQSMAAAEVLTAIYGNNFAFTDDSHLGRAPELGTIAFKARRFHSFYETAEESARSRFLGGIHTRQDNEVGLSEGRKVGRNVNALQFLK